LISFYFPKIPDYEIAYIFRESWSLGAGKVTIASFFTVLCDRGHLIRMMELPLINKFPKYNN